MINVSSSKSLLNTASLGYEIIEEIDELPQKPIKLIEGESLITTMNTGFGENNTDKIEQIPVIELVECTCKKEPNEDSIMDSVNTGLGPENTVIVECPEPEFKIPLCKENYLGEFETAIEKQLARYNLGVYSKEEVENIVSKIVNINITNLVTKAEVETMINNLDYVDSTLKALADYQIPNDLFTL